MTPKRASGTRHVLAPLIGLLLVVAALLIGLLLVVAALLWWKRSPPSPEPVKFTVSREIAGVWAGPEGSLSRLNDDLPYDLSVGHRVETDTTGEAVIESLWAERTCRVYVFRDSALVKAPCPKSERWGEDCLEEGSFIYGRCADHLRQVGTPTAQFEVTGSWVQMIYLPERHLSLLIVYEGAARAWPVIDSEAWTLEKPSDVGAGYFWFTSPGAAPDSVTGLAARVPHPMSQLRPVINALGLTKWVQRTRDHAEEDGAYFPDWMTCASDVAYCEDFDDGYAAWWDIQEGWTLVSEDGNLALDGRDSYWTTLTAHAWQDYRVRYRLKLIEGETSLAYRYQTSDSGLTGYLIVFGPDGTSLVRKERSRSLILARHKEAHATGRWHEIEVGGWGGHVRVFVDGRLELDHIDPAPLTQGSIAFGSSTGAHAIIDDIEVLGSGPEPLTPISTSTPKPPTPTPKPPTSTPKPPTSTPVPTIALPPAPPIPLGPGDTSSVSSISCNQVVLQWQPASDSSEISGYRVVVESLVAGGGPVQSYLLEPATFLVITEGLLCAQSYSWGVSAQDGAGNWSSTSPLLSFSCRVETPIPLQPGTADPAAPGPSECPMTLRWNPIAHPCGVDYYTVEVEHFWSIDGPNYWRPTSSSPWTVSETQLQVACYAYDSYRWRVSATVYGSSSPWSEWRYVTP